LEPLRSTPAARPAGRFAAITYVDALIPAGMWMDVAILSSLIALSGGTAVHVGALSLVASWAGLISQALAPHLLSVIGSRKWKIVASQGATFLSLVFVALSVFFVRGRLSVPFLLVGVFLQSFASGCMSLPWADLQRTQLEKRIRIRVITQAIAISLLVATLANLGVKAVLDSGLAFPANYGLVIAAGALLSGVSWLTFFLLPDDRGAGAVPPSDRAKPVLAFYREELSLLVKDRAVLLLFLAVIFYAVGSQASGLFISLGYQLSAAEMEAMFGTGLVMRMLVKAVAYYLGGRLAARYGNRMVLVLIALAGMVSPLTLLFLPFRYYILVMVATNLIPMWHPFFVNMLMETSQPTRFAGYFTLFLMVPFPVALLGPLLGLLAQGSPSTFGTTVLVSLILGVLLVLRMRERRSAGQAEAATG